MMVLASSEQELRDVLQRLGTAILDYERLQGFLFAMLCSPEEIVASEWFELIWLDDEPQFDSKEEAERFLALLLQAMSDIEHGLAQGRALPFLSPVNHEQRLQLGLWCEGFLMGHQYLEDLWEVALIDIDSDVIDDAVASTLNLASAFSEVLIEDQLHFEEGFEPLDETLPASEREQLTEAYQWFDEVLLVYAEVKVQWQSLDEIVDAQQLFLALEPVGRDEPCPCGSGQKFAKCCLH